MMKKGTGDLPGVNARIEQMIRLAGFIIPVILLLYGCLLAAHLVNSYHPFDLTAFYVIGIIWTIFSLWQFFAPASQRRDAALRLVLHHLLAAAYVYFISGFRTPIIIIWIILFLTSSVYFGSIGFALSAIGLLAIGLVDTAAHALDVQSLITSSFYLFTALIAGYIATVISSTEAVDRDELTRSRAEESLQRDRISTIVNNLADAILSTDKDGLIQVYNAATLNLLDTNSELTGKSIDTVLHLFDGDNKRFKLMRGFHAAHGVQTREDLSATISGETVRLSVIYSPIRSINSQDEPGADGYIVILRDITAQKSLEEERDEFISVVSHELRTPITIAEGALGNLQLMMNRHDIPHETRVENVKMAHEQVVFLARMVNDLSTLSRAERGIADAAEDITISELAHELYNEYAPQAKAKGLSFDLDLDPQVGSVSASRLYLKELIQNFITNAIKYTKAGGVTLTITHADGLVAFAITDTGIGISKSEQARVYDKFWRSEDYRTRETGGTGLGLYVSAKLAHKLGTDIKLTSRLNHGSTFSFELPQVASKPKKTPPHPVR